MANPHNNSRITVEGYRVLKFKAELPKELKDFIERVYQPKASMRYWQRLLGIDGEELESIWKAVPWAYRKAFDDIVAPRVPKRKSYVRFPLFSWTLKHTGADLREGELIIRVYGRSFRIPLPERGAEWLQRQEDACRESGGRLTRYVAVKSEGQVSVVLHCLRNLDAEELLENLEVIATVDVNSSHGFYFLAYDLHNGGFTVRRFKIPKID